MIFSWNRQSAPPRRRIRYGLRTLLIAVAAAAVGLWLLFDPERVREERRAAALVSRVRGSLLHDCQLKDGRFSSDGHPDAPMWLQRLVGPDYFRSIVQIDVSADPAAADALFVGGTLRTAEPASVPLRDDDLAALAALKHLKYLDLSRTTITDAGLRQLKPLTQLRHLSLSGTAVTDAGVQDFQQAVPGCEIDR